MEWLVAAVEWLVAQPILPPRSLHSVCPCNVDTVGHLLCWEGVSLPATVRDPLDVYATAHLGEPSHLACCLTPQSTSPRPLPHLSTPLPHPSPQLVYSTLAEIIGSYWLALIFQVSHVISEVDWPKPDRNNFVNQDW